MPLPRPKKTLNGTSATQPPCQRLLADLELLTDRRQALPGSRQMVGLPQRAGELLGAVMLALHQMDLPGAYLPRLVSSALVRDFQAASISPAWASRPFPSNSKRASISRGTARSPSRPNSRNLSTQLSTSAAVRSCWWATSAVAILRLTMPRTNVTVRREVQRRTFSPTLAPARLNRAMEVLSHAASLKPFTPFLFGIRLSYPDCRALKRRIGGYLGSKPVTLLV